MPPRCSPFLCPICDIRARILAYHPSWPHSRTVATLQKRKPSRMALSPNVRNGPPKSVVTDKTPRQNRNSPFGGMNVVSVPRSLEFAKNRTSPAEKRRTKRPTKSTARADKTKDPMKALKMQRALSNVSYEKRSRVKEQIQERDRFEDFQLLPIIQESVSSQALGGSVEVNPTPIQRLAIPALLGTEGGKRSGSKMNSENEKRDMQQFLLAAETGSGKTLAYTLPIIDAMKRAEAVEAAQHAQAATWKARELEQRARNRMFELEPPPLDEPDPSTARPKAIILVPTAELVDQVGALVKSLSHTIKFRAALISANYSGKIIRSRLFSTTGIDLVVSTPHLLSSITESDPNVLSRVTHLVVDEADSLLDRSFSPITSAIIDRTAPSLKQLILCSATIPRSLDAYMSKRYPEIRRLVTPNLHAIPRRVQLSVVDIDKVPYQGNRDLACAQTVWDIGKEASEDGSNTRVEKKVVVFVNEREKSAELAEYLRSKGIDATGLARDSDERKQADVLTAFTGNGTAAPAKQAEFTSAMSSGDLMEMPTFSNITRRKLANVKVLVMTDLGSRGIDTLPVRHVILYDVPHTSIDFIHRLGRVGRMGRRGRAVVLVGRHDRKDIVREVRDGMFRGQALI